MKLLILLTLFLTACQNKPASNGANIPTPKKEASLSWNNEEWSKHLTKLVKSKFLDLNPKDITEWCPKYESLLVDERIFVLSEVMVQMAKYESNWNPRATYVEKFTDSKNKNVISTGLFQLSVESAKQERYECSMIKTQDDLFDPLKNISCAFNILSYWIQKDGVLSGDGNKGGGRYWSVMRSNSSVYTKIKGSVNNMVLCKK